ncbi:hypothetical protein N7501_008624 [Penicillium viridicatum]|nr:hypothetical protein N7501_008624 [Penicillium viridicatum]
MSLLSLPNELLLSILPEPDVEDVISLPETHQDPYQISFQCLRNRDLDHHLSDPNARNHEGKTPLYLLDPHKPGYDPRCTDIAKLLLDHGADIGAQDLNGATPLHIAASSDTKGEIITALDLAY